MKPATLYLVIVAAIATVLGGWLGWQKLDAHLTESRISEWNGKVDNWSSCYLTIGIKAKYQDADELDALVLKRLLAQMQQSRAQLRNRWIPGEADDIKLATLATLIPAYEALIKQIEWQAQLQAQAAGAPPTPPVP